MPIYKVAFGVAFAALIASLTPAVRSLRRRSGATVNQVGHELPALRVLRPVLGIAFYAALLDWLLPGTRMGWAVVDLLPAVRWAGGAALLAAAPLLWWSFASLGTSYRGGVGLWDDHELVTGGPYRWVRHPIYACFVLATAGAGALSASWLIGAAGVALTLAIPAARLPVEERQLAERFGERYARWRARTPAFVPRPFGAGRGRGPSPGA